MYFAAGLLKEMFNLFYDAPLRAVLAVQEGGNDSDAQIKPAQARARALR